jgi:hypothetical protein
VLESLDDGIGIFGLIMTTLPEKSGHGQFFAILHSDGIDEGNLDVEIGRTITAKTHAPVPLHSGLQLRFHELPAVATMATYVVKGPSANLLIGFSVIGTWAEANGQTSQ